jgi:hypothetical protein
MRRALHLGILVAAVATAAGCGGGGDDEVAIAPPPPAPSPAPAPGPAPAPATTTPVKIAVLDTGLRNALVCLDADANDRCDSGEIQARTDAQGQVTLDVPHADVGKFPVLAAVGTDAVDARAGAVRTAYLLKAPADRPAVVSPWTTMVALQMASVGVTADEGAQALQSLAGLPASPLQNYGEADAPGRTTLIRAGSIVVAAMQRQLEALRPLAGQPDAGGVAMSVEAIERTVRGRMNYLAAPAVVRAGGIARSGACADPANSSCSQAIGDAATAIVAAQALQAQSLPQFAQAQRLLEQAMATTGPVQPSVAGFSLDSVNPGDANNWFYRVLETSAAGAVPEANGLFTSTDRRVRNTNGTLTTTSWTNDAARQGDLHWTGSAWIACPVGSATKSTPRDAGGLNRSDSCEGLNVNAIRQVEQDVAGQPMAAVVSRLATARTGWGALSGFPDMGSRLGTEVFPAGAMLRHRWASDFALALTYDARASNQVQVFSAETAAGGDQQSNPAVACSLAANRSTTPADSLEMMVARNKGTPCRFAERGTITIDGTSHTSPQNVVWSSQSTVSMGTLAGRANQTPAYWTENRLLRVAFPAAGQTAYFECLQRWSDGMVGDCTAIGSGTYTITTLGDARVLSLTNLPDEAAGLGTERHFIERGGKVYFGLRNRAAANSYNPRLNDVAGNALLQKLGIPTVPVQ